ncbi:MAG: sulfatase-like hydrolase/transferase [Acidimicrobiales bacterium]|jgi:arylsulfatase A-like enzyme/multidrug efflux pump subunit AcrA (membrane-fusion protein)
MNLIICSLDTLRADHLSCLGDERGLTPNLDRIAREGALFSQAYATDIPTQPSHTALFTGQFGIHTGIVSHFHPAAYLPEETLWLPSLLRRNGYTTGAVDHLFAMKDWFIRGYDDYLPPPGRSRSPGSVINGIGLPWISEHRDRDFFLFLHFWDAHIPYVPPSPFKERFSHGTAGRIDPDITAKLEGRPSYPLFKQNLYDFLDAMPNLDYIADLYDAEVAYLDFEIGRIFHHLEVEGLLEDTMVVLFGDHGENMTEHDSWFDHAGLYDSVTHVPLLMWAPGRIPVSESDAMVTLVDVLPTVLETLGLPEAEGIDGRSLHPLMRGETTTHRDAVMLSEATWQASRGLRTPDWKYIKYAQSTIYGRDGVELYDVRADPHEQHNVAELHPEVVDELGARLNHWVSAQLAGRPDPMLSVIDAGLPAVARLNDVIAGLTRPRNDVPTPSMPGHELVPLVTAAAGAQGGPDGPAGPSDHLDPSPHGDGGRFAPRNPHRRRLRGVRGVVAGALMLGAMVLLGVAVNDLLLSDPLSASGEVMPAQSAELNMPTTGVVASIPVHVGEVVHAGEVLASQDTTALDAQLATEQSDLAADQSLLQQQESGSASQLAQQVQQLKNDVTTAQLQAASAQQKLTQTTSTADASVSSAQAQVQIEQSLLASDQQTYSDNVPLCESANPPATCASNQRQIQVDQGNLTAAQNALSEASANQQATVGSAQDAVTQANAAVASAQAALAAGSAPTSPQSIATIQAQIQQDTSAIATDKSRLAQAVLTAPFDGVVSAIDGTVGEVASDEGVRQATPAPSVSPSESTGIQIFPQGPQSSSTPTPSQAALITLDSMQNEMVVQVPETQIGEIHVGQEAQATLPAVKGSHLTVTVSQIERTPVIESNETYFRVDLISSSKDADELAYHPDSSGNPMPGSPMVGFTVDVSF